MKILITSYPFTTDVSYLKQHKIEFSPYKYTPNKKELIKLIKKSNPDSILAGTEVYDKNVINICKNLKIISRVGSGVDSIDKNELKKHSISLFNTPYAPSNAVAEYTIGQIFNSIRHLQEIHNKFKKGRWEPFIGRELAELTIGIIGNGTIGKLVISKLICLGVKNILVYDINTLKRKNTLDTTLRMSDIISIHIPYQKNFISYKELFKLKKNAIIINTSRGGIINENALYKWLIKNKKGIAILDVFNKEPYFGKLKKLNNVYITPHMASSTIYSRNKMETEAIRNILTYKHE